jgi:hypothetical protein
MQGNVKKALIIIPIIMLVIGTLTAIMTWVNLAPSQKFLAAWSNSFLFSFVVMLPIGGFIFPLLNKVINSFFTTWSNIQKNLVHGFLMAVIMESMMALVTTLATHGYQSNHDFFSLFFNCLIYALPVGLTITSFISLVIKPRFEQYLAQTPS